MAYPKRHFMPEEDYATPRATNNSFDPKDFFKKLIFLIVFGLILSLRTLISALDKAGASGKGLGTYASAILSSIWNGLVLSLGSMWAVISNYHTYFSNSSWGSILLTFLTLIVLILFFYQPISFIFNILAGKNGEAPNTMVIFGATILFVVILSCVVYYIGGKQTLATPIITETPQQNFTSVPKTIVPINNTVPTENITSTTINLSG
jgi:hypothetical protein